MQGVKLTRLMSIFTSKKVWKFLVKIQLTKFDPKRTRRLKYPPSCQLGSKDVRPTYEQVNLGRSQITTSGVLDPDWVRLNKKLEIKAKKIQFIHVFPNR